MPNSKAAVARPEYACDPMRLSHDRHGNPYSAKPYRPNAARRTFINGPIIPMDHPRSSLSGWAVVMILGAIAGGLLI